MRSGPVPDPPPLSDGVIRLRRRCLQDVGRIAAAAQDPDSRRWLTDTPRHDQDPRASMDRAHRAFTSGTTAPLTIADVANDAPLGLINVQFRDDDIATLAYSVFPRARGLGIAGRAVLLISGGWFEGLRLSELRLEINPANLASRRVADKSGWTLLDGVTTSKGAGLLPARRKQAPRPLWARPGGW